jgi:hypothetical protein
MSVKDWATRLATVVGQLLACLALGAPLAGLFAVLHCVGRASGWSGWIRQPYRTIPFTDCLFSPVLLLVLWLIATAGLYWAMRRNLF